MNTIVPTTDRQREDVAQRRSSRLPDYWSALLRDGDVHSDYSTRAGAAMAFAVYAVRAGWTVQAFTAAMHDTDNRLGDHYRVKDDGRRRNPRSAETKMRREWGKAVRFAADNPQVANATEARQELGRIRAAVLAEDWTGRSGPRNRVVLQVLLDAARRQPTLTPAVSVRTLTEETPYASATTITNALRALTDTGWITPTRGTASADQPTTYRLHVGRNPARAQGGNKGGQYVDTSTAPAPGGQELSTYCPPPAPVPDAESPLPRTTPHDRVNQDLGLVLGLRAALVYAALDPDMPQTKPAIVRRSGVSERTVDKWLKELARMGLARQSPRGWYQGLTDVSLVAAEFGAIDKAFTRADRHALQREGWAQYRADAEARRAEQATRSAKTAKSTRQTRQLPPPPAEPHDPRPAAWYSPDPDEPPADLDDYLGQAPPDYPPDDLLDLP